ncbi:helix-turn-helix domain-containing protein [Streptomyces sp. NPDC054904]
MGRPELPVDHTVPARGALAAVLRKVRHTAGLSYDELAARTGVSATALKRAASGRHVPARETLTAIAKTCHTSEKALEDLWQDARIADRGRLKQLQRPASPELLNSPAAFSAALVYFYERAGAPPLRHLGERAGGAHLLPASTAGRILNQQALPASRQQCIAFLTACGIGPRLRERWADAYDRITSPHREQPHIDDEAAWAIAPDVLWSRLPAKRGLFQQRPGRHHVRDLPPRERLVVEEELRELLEAAGQGRNIRFTTGLPRAA